MPMKTPEQEALKDVFKDGFEGGEAPEHFVQKITYSSDDSNGLIRDPRTEKDFRIAITVTLVATGTDVKPLEIVPFMEDVHAYREINPQYWKLLFSSTFIVTQLESKSVGVAMTNLNLNVLGNTLVPLPPLAEQKRIIERIDELVSMLDD